MEAHGACVYLQFLWVWKEWVTFITSFTRCQLLAGFFPGRTGTDFTFEWVEEKRNFPKDTALDIVMIGFESQTSNSAFEMPNHLATDTSYIRMTSTNLWPCNALLDLKKTVDNWEHWPDFSKGIDVSQWGERKKLVFKFIDVSTLLFSFLLQNRVFENELIISNSYRKEYENLLFIRWPKLASYYSSNDSDFQTNYHTFESWPCWADIVSSSSVTIAVTSVM